jgi:hypothetical protein
MSNARNKSAGKHPENLHVNLWCVSSHFWHHGAWWRSVSQISMEYRLAGKWVFKFKILSRWLNFGFVECITHVCIWDTRHRVWFFCETLDWSILPYRLGYRFRNHYHHASHTDGIRDSLTWISQPIAWGCACYPWYAILVICRRVRKVIWMVCFNAYI